LLYKYYLFANDVAGTLGFPHRLDLRVSARSFRDSAARRPPPLAQWVHPLVSFASPSEFSGPHLPAISRCRAPSVGLLPHRDVNLRSPHSRASQARSVPPSAFLTPSTVYSSAGFAGLFHPAAASGIHPPGVSPPTKPYQLVAGRYPRDVSMLTLPPVARRRQVRTLAFRVLLRAGVRRAAKRVRPCVARAPPGFRLLRVLPPPAVQPISRPLRS
jgi:hypothetical protein